MAKEPVRHLSGVFTSVFAHDGHITKEEAQEISGLAVVNDIVCIAAQRTLYHCC